MEDDQVNYQSRQQNWSATAKGITRCVDVVISYSPSMRLTQAAVTHDVFFSIWEAIMCVKMNYQIVLNI